MALNHLQFFDKAGNNCTPVLDPIDNFFRINMQLDSVSVGLFETEHIFIYEEILKQFLPSQTSLKKQQAVNVWQSTEIRILKYLEDHGKTIMTDLDQFFAIQKIGDDLTGDFIRNHAKLFDRTITGSVFYAENTAYGSQYLKTYEIKERDNILQGDDWKPVLSRPRASYDINNNEETFLYYRWKPSDVDLDEKLFTFMIDMEDPRTYFRGDKAVCEDEGIKYPSIVPIRDKYLITNEFENPDWKVLFSQYNFEPGSSDDFEDPPYHLETIIDDDTGAYSQINVNEVERTKMRRKLGTQATYLNDPFQLNIAINSDIEGEFNRTLEVYMVRKTIEEESEISEGRQYKKYYQNFYKFAEISFNAEVIGKDERLEKTLNNFGRDIDDSEFFIARDYDINDDNPDYIKINEKRKELFLEGEDIYPYLGSYKALTNAIKYFGYSDLQIKEYFYNVRLSDPGTKQISYTAVEIPLDLKVPDESYDDYEYNEFVFGNLMNSEDHKKTSRFGLYYALNQLSGTYDEFGSPIVEDVYLYTNEEVLIKLYGLKQILERRFLPHHARIVDITGEGIYFGKYEINNWQDNLRIIALKEGNSPNFEAIPLSMEIKELNKLLNLYRKNQGIDDVEELTEFTIIKEIENRTLEEFEPGGEIDFPFDKELTLEKIMEFYPEYEELKATILNHLLNMPCYKEVLDEAGFSKWEAINIAPRTNFKMLGTPCLLRYLPTEPTWDDMRVSWDMLDPKTPSLVDDNAHRLYTWDGLGDYEGWKISWRVRHNNDGYCYTTDGFIHDKKEILIFLPAVGKYDVTLAVTDITNFPNITRRDDYIEVKPPALDFVAFGRFIKPYGTFDEMTDVSWDQATGTWDQGGHCELASTWDEADIAWDSVDYKNYINQDYVSPYIKTNKILSVDKDECKVTLSGSSFYNHTEAYRDQKWDNRAVFYKPSTNIPLIDNMVVTNAVAGIVEIQGNYKFSVGEELNVYKYLSLTGSDFYFEGDAIWCKTNNISAFEVGKSIKLIGNYTDRTLTEEYIIKAVEADFISGLVKVTVIDDGSLTYTPFANEFGNLSRYDELELRSDHYMFTINSFVYDESTQKTKITVTDKDKNIKYLKLEDLTEYRAATVMSSGRFVFPILVTGLDSSNNTVLTLECTDAICSITPSFDFQYADFDIDYATRFGSSQKLFWDNYDNVTWDELYHQTWNMLEYTGAPRSGFRIPKVTDMGTIAFDEQIFTFEFGNTGPNNWISKGAELLNKSSLEKVGRFEYYNIRNEYIQAVAKIGASSSLVSLVGGVGMLVSANSYPNCNFPYWKERFFDGYNNPALNKPVKRVWEETGASYVNPDGDITLADPYEDILSGTFNFSDTFIKREDFKIPTNTTVFIVFDRFDQIDGDATFEWELWESSREKLVMRSKKSYMNFNFVDPGAYSVKLTVTTKGNQKNVYEKRGWIYVKNEL